jgi:iron complex transport system permease protein
VIDPLGLLLTGVVLATICGALIMVLNYWVGPGLVKDDIGQWMMGYLNDANLTMVQIRALGVFVLAGLAGLMFLSRAMDAASFSDAEAMSLGVNLKRLRLVLFIVCGLLAAGAVVLAGPIAFVGLICPHIARLLLGPSHRTLLVGSALIGATMLILANIVSIQVHRSFGTGIMPIGAFAALVGGPTFLWMLRPQLGKG